MSYTAPRTTENWHAIHANQSLPGYARASSSSGAWPSANLAIYVPILIHSTVVVKKLFFCPSATGTGNVDMGLFNINGTAVISATNAAKEAGTGLQSFDVTDTTVGPGTYYIGLSSDSSTDTFMRQTVAAPHILAAGVLTEASAYPLPSTATWTADQTNTFLPSVGVLVEETVS